MPSQILYLLTTQVNQSHNTRFSIFVYLFELSLVQTITCLISTKTPIAALKTGVKAATDAKSLYILRYSAVFGGQPIRTEQSTSNHSCMKRANRISLNII